jgi:hypothetical protein
MRARPDIPETALRKQGRPAPEMGHPDTDRGHANCIAEAIRWLFEERLPQQHVIPVLREKFDLTPLQCVEAIRQAERLRRAPA